MRGTEEDFANELRKICFKENPFEKYKVTKKLGEGAGGIVHLARDLETNLQANLQTDLQTDLQTNLQTDTDRLTDILTEFISYLSISMI